MRAQQQALRGPVSEHGRASAVLLGAVEVVPRAERGPGGRVVARRQVALAVAVARAQREQGGARGLQRIEGPELALRLAPARVQRGVHEEHVVEAPYERQRRQPREQRAAILGREHVRERVRSTRRARPGRDLQEVHVVVPEHAPCVEPHQEAQRAERVGPAVDEVAHRAQHVARGIEAHALEQRLELRAAALDVADEAPPHGALAAPG